MGYAYCYLEGFCLVKWASEINPAQTKGLQKGTSLKGLGPVEKTKERAQKTQGHDGEKETYCFRLPAPYLCLPHLSRRI